MSVLPCKSWAACAPRVHPSDENDSGSVEVLLPVTLCGSGILAGESGPLGESPPILENAGIERGCGDIAVPVTVPEGADIEVAGDTDADVAGGCTETPMTGGGSADSGAGRDGTGGDDSRNSACDDVTVAVAVAVAVDAAASSLGRFGSRSPPSACTPATASAPPTRSPSLLFFTAAAMAADVGRLISMPCSWIFLLIEACGRSSGWERVGSGGRVACVVD